MRVIEHNHFPPKPASNGLPTPLFPPSGTATLPPASSHINFKFRLPLRLGASAVIPASFSVPDFPGSWLLYYQRAAPPPSTGKRSNRKWLATSYVCILSHLPR